MLAGIRSGSTAQATRASTCGQRFPTPTRAGNLLDHTPGEGLHLDTGFLEAAALLLGGFTALIGGADVMVRNASRLGVHYGLRPVVIGTTIVAFGTSAPEFLVSFVAGLTEEADLALGNVYGSNVANIALVLGASALVRPIPVPAVVVKVEYAIALGATLLVPALAWDGGLDTGDGVILCAAFAGFFTFYLRNAVRGALTVEEPELPEEGPPRISKRRCWVYTLLGIAVLVAGSYATVDGAKLLARIFSVSEAVIGVTVVALGTSLPELATSMVAAFRSHHDIAVGNVLGSNIFNLLFVLGPAALLPGLTTTNPDLEVITFVMVGVTLLLLPLLLTSGRRISRPQGGLLLLVYLGFMGYLAASRLGL